MKNDLMKCEEHGPYRGEKCPVCGVVGKRLMNELEIEGLSRILAGMLRHFPENYGIRLNEHGWIKVYSIVPAIRTEKKNFIWLTPYHLEAMVKTDTKERYELNSNHEVRATYGHTIPVEMDDLPTDDIPGKLYYQTTDEEYDFIKETGITPSDKTWIHLSKTYRQAYVSGLFHIDSPSVLVVDSEGLIQSGRPVYRATADIFLAKEIPPEFVSVAPAEEIILTEEEKTEVEKVKERRDRKLNKSEN
ncbi:MAG: RNA 2'-phosphotransferase [Thermoplasmataceae archaeon]